MIEISDRGPGVPVHDLERIFEPYVRVSTGNHSPDSTGLGLAIVKRVVEQHGGNVLARNRDGGADSPLQFSTRCRLELTQQTCSE